MDAGPEPAFMVSLKGRKSDQAVLSYLSNGHIKNGNLFPVDFTRANIVYRPPVCTLKGKMALPSQISNDQT